MSGFDMTSISVVEPGHDSYEQLDVHEESKSRHLSTSFYNEVMEVYNESAVGAILLIPLPENIKFFNFKHVFKKRGLDLGDDVLITRQNTDDEGQLLPRSSRPAKMKKLSDKSGRIIDMFAPVAEDG